MRLLMMGLIAALVVEVSAGQEEMSLEDYATLMESNRQAFSAVEAAVDTAAYQDARANVAILRRNFQGLSRFWSARERADAVGIEPLPQHRVEVFSGRASLVILEPP